MEGIRKSLDWTFPSTTPLIDATLGKVAAGANLPAGMLTLPAYKLMQDFVPAEGKEVFIITDRVTLLGKNSKQKTVDSPHLYKTLWPHTQWTLYKANHKSNEWLQYKGHPCRSPKCREH